MLNKTGFILVFLMTLLQGFYAGFAFLDPLEFANLRGTELASHADLDWIKIYASRTLFAALIIGYLLYLRSYKILLWAALFGTVMPVTDAWLAYQSGASLNIIVKHIATVAYLLITFMVLQGVVKRENT